MNSVNSTWTLRDHRARRKSVGKTLRKFSAVLRSRKITQERIAAELRDTLEQLYPNCSWSFTQQAVSKHIAGEVLPERKVLIGWMAAIDKLTDGQMMNMPLFTSVLLLDASYRGLDDREVFAAFPHRSADGDFVPIPRVNDPSMDYDDLITPIANFYQVDFNTCNARTELYSPLQNIRQEVSRSLQETDDRPLYPPADFLSPSVNRAKAFGRCFKRLLEDHTDLGAQHVESAFFEECNRLYPDGAKNLGDQAAPLTASPQRWIEGACLPREREALIVVFSVMARSLGATILPIHFDLMAMAAGYRGLEERELGAIFPSGDGDRLSKFALSTADRKGAENLVRAEYRALVVQRKMQPSLYWAYEKTEEKMPEGERFDRRQFLDRFNAAQAIENHRNQYQEPKERRRQERYMAEYADRDRPHG